MSKNRKHQTAAIRFGPALKAALLCLLIGGSGVGYVWQKDQIVRLGQETKKKETLLAKREYENDKLRKQLAELYSPPVLERKIKDLKLGLVLPQHAQVIYLQEPGNERTPTLVSSTNAARQYASQTQRSLVMP